ncbi:hypothetical protein LAG72_24915 [Escherichia coli]|uniref:Uncharacterized protein n=1 Tax=Rhizobium phage RHEph21 TaxID=2836134 RepID=A0AAE7VN29_9CAUD|nr:hypothetical protein [Escherichia coli]MBZ5864368.1 hypothetical protein [Escherichia coli]QXV74639.1 hypothetical protein [Rhizobium phage RHEph21]
MKQPRFRIVPALTHHYYIQRKGLLFWRAHKAYHHHYCGSFKCIKYFDTKAEARSYIDDMLEREARFAAHLAQPVEEYPQP